MRVLLLSHNHTVQEMVALALRETKGVELVTAQAADQIEPTTYDMVIIDDALPLYDESVALLQVLGVEPVVLLAHGKNTETEPFDRVIRKPFLPAEIREMVESERERIGTKRKKKHPRKKKKHTQTRTAILDPDEIETIKSLLEEEGLEVIGEEELTDSVLQTPADVPESADVWIKALSGMKAKKLRKLLRGATVRIEIVFPERSR